MGVITPTIDVVGTVTISTGAHPAGTDRWRIDEFAHRVDTSVDTIRFYQKRGLLAPPEREGRVGWYGPEHADRIARIRDLQQRGLSLAVIQRLLNGELDAADQPLVEAVVAADDADAPCTLEELAALSDVPLSILEAVANEGLLIPRVVDGEARYSASDADVVRAGLTLLEAGIPLPELVSLARQHTAATRAIAEAAVSAFDRNVREPLTDSALTDDERAVRMVEAFEVMLPAVSTMVGQHFRRVLLEVAQEHLAHVSPDDDR